MHFVIFIDLLEMLLEWSHQRLYSGPYLYFRASCRAPRSHQRALFWAGKWEPNQKISVGPEISGPSSGALFASCWKRQFLCLHFAFSARGNFKVKLVNIGLIANVKLNFLRISVFWVWISFSVFQDYQLRNRLFLFSFTPPNPKKSLEGEFLRKY